jgi:hypothetical protein
MSNTTKCAKCNESYEFVFVKYMNVGAGDPAINCATFIVDKMEDYNHHFDHHMYSHYGSNYDYSKFDFIKPNGTKITSREELLANIPYFRSDANVCDECITEMCTNKVLKRFSEYE